MGVFVISPLPSLLLEPLQTAGLLRSTDITPLLRYYEPIRHPLAVPRFPGLAGYTVPCSADFAAGRGGLLQLLGASLSSCCRYYPARVSRRIGQIATLHAAFAPLPRARPLGLTFSRPPLRLLSLRPDDLLPIPRMALSIDFQDSVSFLPTIQATRLLTLASAGLTPAEYTSLSWTYGNGYWFPPRWYRRAVSCRPPDPVRQPPRSRLG
jgi:hypothetical protein